MCLSSQIFITLYEKSIQITVYIYLMCVCVAVVVVLCATAHLVPVRRQHTVASFLLPM